MSLQELYRSFHLKNNHRRPLQQMLEKLKKRGLIEELTHDRFLFRQTPKAPAVP